MNTTQPFVYRGQFDSESHARWAIFFSAIGLRWVYRPNCAGVNQATSRPTFLLVDWQTLVTVVPLDQDAIRQAREGLSDAQQHIELPLLLLIGEPGDRLPGALFCFVLGRNGGGTDEVPVSWAGSPHGETAYLVPDDRFLGCEFRKNWGAKPLEFVIESNADDISLRYCDPQITFAQISDISLPDWNAFLLQKAVSA